MEEGWKPVPSMAICLALSLSISFSAHKSAPIKEIIKKIDKNRYMREASIGTRSTGIHPFWCHSQNCLHGQTEISLFPPKTIATWNGLTTDVSAETVDGFKSKAQRRVGHGHGLDICLWTEVN